MFQQAISTNHPIYCKLVPQTSLIGSGITYLLELLPTNEVNDYPQNISNQCNFLNAHFIQPVCQNQQPNTMNYQKYLTHSYQKVIRKKVHLDQNALKFKEKFYSFFTYRKKIPKDLVFNIHNNIAKEINLRYVTREECRSVDKYFKNFSSHQKEIISYLNSLSNEQRNKLQIKSNHLIDSTENVQ